MGLAWGRRTTGNPIRQHAYIRSQGGPEAKCYAEITKNFVGKQGLRGWGQEAQKQEATT